ncbi:MAG: pitrilysin family protein [bacterium]
MKHISKTGTQWEIPENTYKKTVLDNGLRVITEELTPFKSASIGLWVNVGSMIEDEKNNGICHFIEHMLFKGTERHTATEIAELMDGVGGHLNAFTEKEQTCYYARVVDQHIPLAIDMLAEMFQTSLFDPKELDREKNVILDEIRMYEDSPDDVIFDMFTRSVWGDHALGRSTLGTQEVIRGMSRENFLDFMAERYTPENIIIAAAGHLTHESVVEQVSRLFGHLKKSSLDLKVSTPESAVNHIIRHKDCEQIYLCLGGNGLSQRDEDKYKLLVLDSILGGSMSSRLFQEIREKRGLVYTVCTFLNSFGHAGLFGVFAGTSNGNLSAVMDLILSILDDIRTRGVTAEELVRAKEHIKGAIYLALESTTNRMVRLAKSESYHGRLIPHEEVIEKIMAVTVEGVNGLAARLLRPEAFSLAVLGPVSENESEILRGKLR